jgi:hypothetical protein
VSDEASPAPPDNVVRLAFGQQSEIAPTKTGKGKCYHRGAFTLDSEERTVQCHCGATLDAFTLLLAYANRERDWRDYDLQVREAQQRLDELKDEERKVKARTKAASKKDADAAVAAERARSEQERFQIIQAARDIAASCRRIERITTRRRTTT